MSSLRGDVAVSSKHLAAAGFVAGPLNVKAKIAGRRVDLNGKASAYGAGATASGRVVLPDFSKQGDRSQPIDFDLRGQILNVDLRRLPRNLNIPPADTNVDADYHVAGRR